MSPRLPLLAAGLLCCCAATAADWPEFRGPNRDGICTETGLLKSWPKDGPPKVWTAKGLGFGYGTPSVAEGKIFGMGTLGGKDGVWALKESDGSQVWFTPFDNPRKTNQNNGPSGTPTYHDGKVYAVSSLGKLVCLDAQNGKQLWGKDYIADFGGKVPGWGYTESPLVDGEKLICTPGAAKSTMVALDKDTGKEIWKADLGPVGGGAGYASPIKATVGGVPMYITLLGKTGGVVAVHADTGKLLWQYAKINNSTANIPTVVTRDDLVWCSTGYGDGGAALLKMKADGKDKVTVTEVKRYASGELQNHHGGMVLVGDYIYFGSGHTRGYPACVEFKTGDIMWKEKQGAAGGDGSAAVVYADGMLYFRYQNGIVALIEATQDGLKVAGSFKEPDRSGKESWPYPVIANGKLYLRDQDKLHCFNVKAEKG